MSWISKVDFAWVGYDCNNNVALFYVDERNVPVGVKQSYTEESYNRLTGFIIDELPEVSDNKYQGNWEKYDSGKGFFVFEFDEKLGGYKKAASPTIALTVEVLSKFDDEIIDCSQLNYSISEYVEIE